MPPEIDADQLGEIDILDAGRMRQRVVERVDARNEREVSRFQRLHETRDVARIGDQQLAPADLQHQKRAGGQSEDVIERQRRHHHVVRVDRRSTAAIHASHCMTFAATLRWSSIAPLATPVVPPVYCRNAISSGEHLDGVRRCLRALRHDLRNEIASRQRLNGLTAFFTWRDTRLTIAPLSPSRSPGFTMTTARS